jgi:Protein of unknown function (DUF1091)
MTIKEVSGRRPMDTDVYFLKGVNTKLTVQSKQQFFFLQSLAESIFALFQIKTSIFRMVGEKPQLMIAAPKFNYCDLRRGITNGVFEFKNLFDSFVKFGNLTHPCPFKKGYYYHRNVLIDDRMLPSILKMMFGKFLIRLIIADESKAKVSVWLTTINMYLVYSD